MPFSCKPQSQEMVPWTTPPYWSRRESEMRQLPCNVLFPTRVSSGFKCTNYCLKNSLEGDEGSNKGRCAGT